MRIATFNVQNLRLREAGDERRLDGARDGDTSVDTADGAPDLDHADRRLTAAVLHDMDADVVALLANHEGVSMPLLSLARRLAQLVVADPDVAR